MQGKTVTIFGGSGFLGHELTKHLVNEGATVRIASRTPKPWMNAPDFNEKVEHVTCDVTNENQIETALNQADYAVNLVGILFEKGKQTFDVLHHQAAGLIAQKAKQKSLEKLTHVSAIGADLGSPALYAQTKAKGEAAVLKSFPDATILRPSIVFGPEDSFFNKFADMSKFGPGLPVIGTGKTRFQPVFVGDVAKAIVKTLCDKKTNGNIYELGGPKIYTFEELMRLVLSITKRKRLIVKIPTPIAKFMAKMMSIMPKPVLTNDQIKLLKRDNIVSKGTMNFADLNIEPKAVEDIVPTYL